MLYYITGVHTLEPDDYDELMIRLKMSSRHPHNDDTNRVSIIEGPHAGIFYSCWNWVATVSPDNDVKRGIIFIRKINKPRITARSKLAELRASEE